MQHQGHKLRYGILAADTLWVALALCLVGVWRSQGEPAASVAMVKMYVPLLAIGVAGWWIIFIRYDLDGFHRGWKFGKLLSEIAVGVAILALALSAFVVLLHDFVPRLAVLSFSALLPFGFVCNRLTVFLALSLLRSKPHRRVVIIGNERVSAELLSKIERHPEMRCEVVGFLYPSELESESVLENHRETSRELNDVSAIELLQSKNVTDVIIGPSPQGMSRPVLALANRCRDMGICVSTVPQSYELYGSRPSLIDLDGLPVLSLDKMPQATFTSFTKGLLDVLAIVASLPLALPVLALAAACVRIRTGKAFCKELRCGKDGAVFFMYRLNVERGREETRIARLLAQLSITELPQLWNVLRGDMSIVGPRPEQPERVRSYSEWQRQRLSVRPGITGLAQVHGLREQSSSEEKSRFDLEYIVSWTPWLDCVLVLETVWTLAARLFTRNTNSQRGAPVSGGIAAGAASCGVKAESC